MKVLSLIHRYHPAVGGAESHMGAINKRLVERGHSVTVLTTDAADFSLFWEPAAGRFAELEDEHDGVRILRFPVRHLPFSKWAFPAVRLFTGWMARVMPNSPLVGRMTELTPRIPAMRQWLADCTEEFDIVLGMTITLEGIIQMGQDFARQRAIPFVIFPLTHLGYGDSPGSDGVSRFYTLPQQTKLVLGADGVVANNPTERDFYARLNVAADKIIIAPPAPDKEKLAGGDGQRWRDKYDVGKTPIVAVVSTLTQAKGTLDTLNALQLQWTLGAPIKLVLAGTIMPDVAAAIEALPADQKQHLILLGRVSDAERNDLLAAADLFCMPSIVDSFGIAFVEAMLYKTPVIGATVWGVKEFVIRDGENGFLVEPNGVGPLANQIGTILSKPELARQMGENGYAFASQLSWDDTVEKIETLLHRLIQSNQSKGANG